MNNILKLGLILAGLSIVMSLIMRYVMDLSMLFSWKFMLISLVINSLVLIFLGRKFLRDPEEGRLGYGQAVKKLFLALLVSTFIGLVFTTALYSNDAELKTAFEKYEIEVSESAIRMTGNLTGQSEAEQEALIEEMRQQREAGELPGGGYPYRWSQFPVSFFFAAISNLLFALLIALFVREKESQYA